MRRGGTSGRRGHLREEGGGTSGSRGHLREEGGAPQGGGRGHLREEGPPQGAGGTSGRREGHLREEGGRGHRREEGEGTSGRRAAGAAVKLPCETSSLTPSEHTSARGQKQALEASSERNWAWRGGPSAQHRASETTGQGVRELEPTAQTGPSHLGLGVCPSARSEAQQGWWFRKEPTRRQNPWEMAAATSGSPDPGAQAGSAWRQVEAGRSGKV